MQVDVPKSVVLAAHREANFMAIDAAETVGDLAGGGVFLHRNYDEMSADAGFDDFHPVSRVFLAQQHIPSGQHKTTRPPVSKRKSKHTQNRTQCRGRRNCELRVSEP